MMIAIDGSYSTDLNYWVRFGSERLENAIRSIPVVSGLVLSGRLSMADCQSIRSKMAGLVILDLGDTLLPEQVSREWLTANAPQLKKLVWPTQEARYIV